MLPCSHACACKRSSRKVVFIFFFCSQVLWHKYALGRFWCDSVHYKGGDKFAKS